MLDRRGPRAFLRGRDRHEFPARAADWACLIRACAASPAWTQWRFGRRRGDSGVLRRQVGLKWNQALEAGRLLVGTASTWRSIRV